MAESWGQLQRLASPYATNSARLTDLAPRGSCVNSATGWDKNQNAIQHQGVEKLADPGR